MDQIDHFIVPIVPKLSICIYRVAWTLLSLLYFLATLPYDVVLVQTPPAIPVMAAVLFVSKLLRRKRVTKSPPCPFPLIFLT